MKDPIDLLKAFVCGSCNRKANKGYLMYHSRVQMSAREIMTKPPLVMASPDESVRDVVSKMFNKGIGSVVIIDGEGRPIGIFTEKDLIRAVAEDVPLNQPVEEVMSTPVVTISEQSSLTEAVRLMSERFIRHLPVVDERERLVGMLSARDIIKYVYISGIPLVW